MCLLLTLLLKNAPQTSHCHVPSLVSSVETLLPGLTRMRVLLAPSPQAYLMLAVMLRTADQKVTLVIAGEGVCDVCLEHPAPIIYSPA